MAKELIWAEAAVVGLEEAADYIARDSLVYAAALLTGAQNAAQALTEFPLRVGTFLSMAIGTFERFSSEAIA